MAKSSWVRKGFEVYFTVLIELLWSKERIIEVYLNSIEMGPIFMALMLWHNIISGANQANCDVPIVP